MLVTNLIEYYTAPSTHDMVKSSEEYKCTSEIDSDVFWESQEEIRNLPKIPLNSKFKDQTNASIEGNMESFDNTMNIGQGNLIHHYEYLSDESIRDDAESIGRGRMSSSAEYYGRFKI